MNRPKDARNSRLQFLKSATEPKGYPTDSLPEIAMIGRSNAGKSTLINGIANSRIALVSSTPGKTRLLNFYQSERYRLVDMPGYGFAKRTPDEQRQWQKMIESYLASRENLIGLVIVMDARRSWESEERSLLKWISPRDLPAAIVLTKIDKISKSELVLQTKKLRDESGVANILACSSLKKVGYSELEEFLYLSWVKPARERKK